MATFTKRIEINLGDYLRFKTHDNETLCGTVQCISEFPDIFVETGDPEGKSYRRYRTSVNCILDNYTNDDWFTEEVSFKKNEELEFVYDDEYKRKIVSIAEHTKEK